MHEVEKFHERLLDDIDGQIVKESEVLVDGSASDFADYKRRVGRIRGLKEAKQLASDLLSRSIRDDEDDE